MKHKTIQQLRGMGEQIQGGNEMSKELKAYIAPTPDGTGLADYYLKSEADKVIAEKDKEIAELKARIQLDDDEMAGFLQLEEECGGGDLRNYIAELKQKLKDVQASAYAESVDAGMRERRLKRALWTHRAITAKLNKEGCKVMREYNPFMGIEEYKWQEVERKCRAKAEEYR